MGKKEIKKYVVIASILAIALLLVQNINLLVGFIGLIISAIYPLILGGAIAFVFNIFLSACEKYYFPSKKSGFLAYSRRPVCLIFSIALVVTVVTLILKIIIPELVACFNVLYDEVPDLFEKVKIWAIANSAVVPDIQKEIASLDLNWSEIIKDSASFITTGAGGILSGVADFIGSFTVNLTRLIIAIIFAIYILICKDGIKLGFSRLKNVSLEKEKANKFQHIVNVTNETFKKFFIGQFTEAIILGTLCVIGMLCLKLPYAMMTGTVIGVTALIPIVGAYIGAVIGGFMILTVSPTQALIFLIFLVILQQLEGNLIYPKVVGSSIGLPGIWVLAAVIVGGSLFGIVGMLLGVPLVATVYKLSYEKIAEKEIELGIPQPDISEKNSEKNKKNSKQKSKRK